MNTETRLFKLLISNNIQEDTFANIYGLDLFNTLKSNAFSLDRGRCAACGHEPMHNNASECLSLHIPTNSINKINPELTTGYTLCKMCHATQHIENAAKNKWVDFVNSIHDQNHLIRLVRSYQVYGAIQQRNIIMLKKTPEQFLQEWYSGAAQLTNTLKVVFNNNFIIDDL